MVIGRSKNAANMLPVLSERIAGLAYAAARLPAAAAREMALAVQYDARRQVDPYGQPWAPVRDRKGLHRHDTQNHVRDSWAPVVDGTDAIVASEHHAAKALQPKDPKKRRYRRLRHPIPGEGLGTWQKRIERMHRRLIRGAMMGEKVREELKVAAEWRRIARHNKRNAERALTGKKALPYRSRKVRSDRARVDALVVRAIG